MKEHQNMEDIKSTITKNVKRKKIRQCEDRGYQDGL